MPFFDLPLDELRAYAPQVREPADFDAFWTRTLAESRSVGGAVAVVPMPTPLTVVDLYDVTFPGFLGEPVKAWLATPHGATGPLPGIVETVGYRGGRGLAHEAAGWALAGYAYLRMDTRGQGSGSVPGDTADPHGNGPAFPGLMTRGIESPEGYYYRRLITDAVRAVDTLRSLPLVDPDLVSVVGISQGGGLAIAVAGLVEGLVAVTPNVPFLCHFERAVGLTVDTPYDEINGYLRCHRDLVEPTFETLSYVDAVNFAKRATAPALFSTGLQDQTCPPSTVFAAFNHYGAPGSAGADDKHIEVYRYNDHKGGEGFQWPLQVGFVERCLSRAGV
ncbi:acetylxylan esterase [Raineyella sp. LH-20]|uniref:acetylxylan esterase n=1 Tax=Raineyella sp. LH-20 TaxID=3081204 RepID=UPI0029552802|nr:acetylxylan esterase [Raineyella sp. LH-20]WOP19317.1 acetylxylan esterase [Raineyella sp. LH-20]